MAGSFGCKAAGANFVASLAAVQRLTGSVGLNLSEPTGGAANGIPRKMRTLPDSSPFSGPLGVCSVTETGEGSENSRLPFSAIAA